MSINLNLIKIYNPSLEEFLDFLNIELMAYNKFIQDSEEKLKIEELELNRVIKEKIQEGLEEQYVYQYHETDDIVLFNVRKIQRESQLLALFSFFESKMKILCNIFKEESNQSLSIKDLSGTNYIEQGRKYMIKVLNLNLDSLDKQWQKIKLIQEVRNCVAHENSNFKKSNEHYSKQKLYATIKEIIKINLGEFIVLDSCDFQISDSRLLINFCDIQKEFFCKVIEIFDNKIKEN